MTKGTRRPDLTGGAEPGTAQRKGPANVRATEAGSLNLKYWGISM